MAINRVEIKDFMVFKGELALDFCPGVNVFIGGNGTGKTTLLKAMYALWDVQQRVDVEKKEKWHLLAIQEYFPYFSMERSYISKSWHDYGDVILKFSPNAKTEIFALRNVSKENNLIFIPNKDLLAHSKGFLALYHKYKMPFDKTYADILLNAELPPTLDLNINSEKLLSTIETIIGGQVLDEGGIFYIIKENGEKVPFSLEASAYQKFGLLWKLLRNGLIEDNSILLWDEPENSLNPELVPVLVDILLELSRNGVQIFIASHDYNFVRYFDVRVKKDISVLFHNLTKNADGQIVCESSSNYLKLTNNLLEDSAEELFDAVIADGMRIQRNG